MIKSVGTYVFFGLFLTIFFAWIYIPILSVFYHSMKFEMGSGLFCQETYQAYSNVFFREDLKNAFYNSALIGLFTIVVSCIISLLVIYYIYIKKETFFIYLSYLNLVIPDIVFAIGFLIFFDTYNVPLGYTTLVIPCSVSSIGYLFPLLYYRLLSINESIIEASFDLGATSFQTWRYIIFPLIKSSLVFGSILTFILTFDDFVISYFCSSISKLPLSIAFLSYLRVDFTEDFFAFNSMVILLFGFLLYLYYRYLDMNN